MSSNPFASFKITRVEPFSEPPVNRSQQFARLMHLALVAPEPHNVMRRLEAGRSRSPPPVFLSFLFDAFDDPQRLPVSVLLAGFTPERDGELQYRMKSAVEEHERIALESELGMF
jgi:hypothetical protein